MNIWILDADSGVSLVYAETEVSLPVNEDLVSGLLTALNQFTLVEFRQPIESIEMGGLRWVYVPEKDAGIIFIAADNKTVSAEILKARLIVIQQSFIQTYIPNKETWKGNWNGNVEMFKDFKQTISEYYAHWKQAENITTLAEFFDIIGIFQQILNILMNVIESRVPKIERERIYFRIDKMFKSFQASEYVKNDPGLNQITYDRQSGFNIINVMPNESNMLLVEREIILMISAVVRTVKEESGYLASLNHFAEEKIFAYILDNLSLLQELHLDQFLLKLFLLK